MGVINFDLTSLVIPGAPAGNNCTTFAINAICIPNGSPIVFDQESATQVAISFDTNEIAYFGTSGTGSTPYSGVFSTQVTATIPDLLSTLETGGTVTATWSSTQSPVPTTTSPVPEPSTFAYLLGPGLAGIALLKRRIRRS
jgi:hypothetical protein